MKMPSFISATLNSLRKGLRRILLSRVSLAVLGAIILADQHSISAYERFIGDPLQARGFGLDRQMRVAIAAATISYLFMPPWNASWWVFAVRIIPSCYWVHLLIFGDFDYLKPRPEDDLPVMNWRRADFYGFSLRVVFFLLMFLLERAPGILPFLFFTWLHLIIACCQPKPPKPKRLRVLVPVEGM